MDGGTPLGNPAELPPPVEWPAYEDRWAYEEVFGRPPDLVVESEPFTVVANGMDQWPQLEPQETGLTEPRWIRAVEVKPADPASRYVFHHGNPSLEQGGVRTGLVASAVGKACVGWPQIRSTRDAETHSVRSHLLRGMEGPSQPPDLTLVELAEDLELDQPGTGSASRGLEWAAEAEVPLPTKWYTTMRKWAQLGV